MLYMANPVCRYGDPQVLDLKDPEKIQKFFLDEIQLGEECLAHGMPSTTAKIICSVHCGSWNYVPLFPDLKLKVIVS